MIVRARARYLQREQVAVEIGQHRFTSDHPARLGGDDLGPSPGELIAAALAT